MDYPTLEETSVVAVGLNRFKECWDDVRLVSMYRGGRHTGQWQNHLTSEVADEILHLTTAWRMIGLRPQECVAIMSRNRPRWLTTSISLLARNAVTVPIYPTLTTEAAAFILRDSDAKYLVVDTMDQARKILPVFDELKGLRKIFVMDPMSDRTDPRVGAYDDLIAMARGKVDADDVCREARDIVGDDVAVIVYTSGTTGRPKGVVLTNTNILSQRIALEYFGFSRHDVFLNHLPFSHSFGLTADMFGSIGARATLAIAEGMAPRQIRHALTTIRPTVLMSVPRLFEKIYVQVQQVVSQKPPRVQAIFNAALDVGKRVFDLKTEGKRVPAALALKYVLMRRITSKVRKQAGLDRVRIAYAGGAPTSRELCCFFQSLGIDIYQGYGLTETSPIANVNLPGKNKLGTVGPPILGVEEKIAEDGEILIRGDNVMKGYHSNPEATAEVIDDQGWFHTGDIGAIDDDGYLRILDRKKELIITSGGKNIAPQAIESAFNTDVYIERVVVIGDGRKYLCALVCPNFQMLRRWARERDIQFDSDADLAAHPEIVRLIEDRVWEVNKGFARFEQIKKIAVMDHEFSEETGELTPTLKVKRRVVDSTYSQTIASLYSE
ncbi:MAG: long-chain fatty acid--CoA ligase [Phycisphaerae bacterium]|nr:long-chain fatty acid--CoA ligase [Phycisphaerae bacterium]